MITKNDTIELKGIKLLIEQTKWKVADRRKGLSTDASNEVKHIIDQLEDITIRLNIITK